MKDYLNSLLPRIRRYSDSLDKKSILIEQPWVIIDNEGNYEKLIFKNNQELIMSLNGIVSVGTWEYLSGAKSLFIDINKSKVLLNQEFIEKGLLVLKYDGFSDKYFLLANENIIPNLDVEKYLMRIFYNKRNISLIESSDKQRYEIARDSIDDMTGAIGQFVFQNANPINDGAFQSRNSKVNYYIKKSRIYKKSIVIEVKTLSGITLFIESFFITSKDQRPKKGDVVRLNNFDFAPDGIYKISLFKKIRVENRVII